MARKATIEKRIHAYLAAKDRGKQGYTEADQILQELLAELEPGDKIPLPDGQVAELVDNFAKGNKAYKPCGINRFDLKVTHA
jgi:hypothetical protein